MDETDDSDFPREASLSQFAAWLGLSAGLPAFVATLVQTAWLSQVIRGKVRIEDLLRGAWWGFWVAVAFILIWGPWLDFWRRALRSRAFMAFAALFSIVYPVWVNVYLALRLYFERAWTGGSGGVYFLELVGGLARNISVDVILPGWGVAVLTSLLARWLAQREPWMVYGANTRNWRVLSLCIITSVLLLLLISFI